MIARTFRELHERDELALMPFLTAGYPTLDESMRHLRALAEGGADLIEIGVPFSDPVADGPTIQGASHRALTAGTSLATVLRAVEAQRLATPLILMSYLNPLLSSERPALLERMRRAGICGLIVPDLPLEESRGWGDAAGEAGIDLIQLVAPTTPPERARRIAESARGFLYYVSVAGTTGARQALPADLFASLARLRDVTDLPLAVGFGLSLPEQIRTLRGRADGAVVGSRIVEAIRDGENLLELTRALKSATKEHETC